MSENENKDIKSPKDAMANAAAGQDAPKSTDGGLPPMVFSSEVNTRLKNEEVWLARHRMFAGEIMGMEKGIQLKRMSNLKQGFNVLMAGGKTLFDMKNPGNMIMGAVSITMAAWDLALSVKEIGQITEKIGLFKGFQKDNLALGVKDLGNAVPYVGSDQKEVHVIGFKDTMLGAMREHKDITATYKPIPAALGIKVSPS